MRHKMVDAAHQHMIQQALHHGRAFGPAIRAKHFAHRAALHMRLDMRVRGSQLGQHIVEKCWICDAALNRSRVRASSHAWHDLVQHYIDARHVLSIQRAEIVPGGIRHARVGVHVFDDMANVFHAMRFAPFAQLLGKRRAPQAGQGVHIGIAHLCVNISHGIPQAANKGSASPPRALCISSSSASLQEAPGPACRSGGCTAWFCRQTNPAYSHSQLRFIGKEAREGVAKIPLVVLLMRLINGFDQCGHAFRVDGMEIVFLTAKTPVRVL